MRSGIRQKLIFMVFTGLFVTMGLIGAYRYVAEQRAILADTRSQGERSGALMAELSAPYLLLSDYSGLHLIVQSFMRTPDAQEVTIIDREGRQLVHKARPSPGGARLVVGPFPIRSDTARLGEVRIAVFPADMDSRLRAYALSALLEHLLIFVILAGIIYFSLTRTIINPVHELGSSLAGLIDKKDFTRRIQVGGGKEIGELASGVNYLIARLEQFIAEMGSIAARISETGPLIAHDTHEVRKNAEAESAAVQSVSGSIAEMSSSIQSIAESAESLSASAEETSSAILQMNASNQEVARHTAELTSSVEDVTTAVTEMIASIREIAGHVESLSSAAEQTSASATQIEATVREVERAAKDSAHLSQQVSQEAKDIGVASIQETIAAMQTIREAVNGYSEMVMRLGKRSEEIGKILNVIVEVTERTNLLALNASILAAQAGEHGRGFAVVAEQIKALADRTAGSAQDIGKLISSVQREAKDTVAAMAGSLSAVERGVQRTQEARAALDTILASSTRSAERATMIERAMTEQARGIKQVSEAIANVRQMTTQIAGATQGQTQGTEMILAATDEMRDIARRVRTAMDEQGRGGRQIAVAADNVTMRAGSIASGSHEQRKAIGMIQDSLGRIQDLPLQNINRIESMASRLRALGEQSALLNQEIVSMTVRRGRRDSADNTLKMGVIPLEAPAEMYRRFLPLCEYLTESLGRTVELATAVDFAQTLKDLEEGVTDLAFLTPTTYIEAQQSFGVELLVKALRNGEPYMHATIVVRPDSGITAVEEIRGGRFAFGDPKSTSSYLIPRSMLADAGVKLDDLRGHSFLGHHDDVARAVIAGEFDAGGLRESTARAFEGKGLRIIKTSIAIPEFNICIAKRIDRHTGEQIRKALLALDRRDHARILTTIDPEYTGFTAAVDSDYDDIRRIVRSIG